MVEELKLSQTSQFSLLTKNRKDISTPPQMTPQEGGENHAAETPLSAAV